MNGKALAEVALKTWGLILIVSLLFNTPFVLMFLANMMDGDEQAAILITNFLGQIILGFCLLRWGGNLAQRWIPDTPELRLEVNATDLRSISFAIVGLFLLVSGLGVVTKVLLGFFFSSSWDDFTVWAYLSGKLDGEFVIALVQIPAGMILVFGWSSIARRLGLHSAKNENTA